MECLVIGFGLLLSFLVFGVLNVQCYTNGNAPSPLVKSLPELGAKQSGSKGACSGQSCLRTVAVKCGKSSMEVHVKADLFGTGVPVKASELAVLAAGTDEQSCRITVAGDAQYKVEVPFNKCGTGFQMNGDWLIYSNLLLYTPTPSPRRILRMSPATIPIQCWFSRKLKVSSKAVVPTWAPLISTVSQESKLDMDMKLMTRDWSSELLYSVYQLGEVIHVEASVEMGTHMPLRVYVDSCVATQSPDVYTSPRYAFIENNGCMMDGLITSSTHSYFLPRLQNDRLRFQLEAFMFQGSPSNASVVFITCILKAVLITQSSPGQRACSFIDGRSVTYPECVHDPLLGLDPPVENHCFMELYHFCFFARWRSADSTDQVCVSCSRSASANSLDQPVQYNQPRQSNQQKVWKQQATLGPFVVKP